MYCDTVGLCVTTDRTEFIYTNGGESGIKVGFINYPRLPKTPQEIKNLAIELANLLMLEFKQYKVSIVCTDETIMLENDTLKNE